MRLWSIHPKYLDAKGLVALWREALLAKHVLEGKTKGYRQHPQLKRFKQSPDPVQRINEYLSYVFLEAEARGYRFNREKIEWNFTSGRIPVARGQIDYEMDHLRHKLKIRDPQKLRESESLAVPELHPVFFAVDGGVEDWEILPE